MRLTDFLRDVGNPLTYYPSIARVLGGVKEAIFIAQILYWQDKTTNELGVYKTREDILNETGLSFDEQTIVRRNLRLKGILIENNKRLEHRIYYKIDLEKLNNIWDENLSSKPVLTDLDNLTTSESGKPIFAKPHLPFSPNGQTPFGEDGKPIFVYSTKITTKTTTTERVSKNTQSEDLKLEENQNVVVDEKIKEKIKHTRFEPLLTTITLSEAIKEHGIEKVLSILDMLIYQYCDKQVDNPAGLLIKALKQGLDKPPGYVSREEKEEQEKKLKIKQQELEEWQRRKEEETKEWEDKFNRLDKSKQNLFLKRAREKTPFTKNPQIIKGCAIDIFKQASNTTGVPP